MLVGGDFFQVYTQLLFHIELLRIMCFLLYLQLFYFFGVEFDFLFALVEGGFGEVDALGEALYAFFHLFGYLGV